MKLFLRRLVGADKPKIIVVIATTRATAERALFWLQWKKITQYAVWCFCVEDCKSIDEFDRFYPKATLGLVNAELQPYWSALTIISWTGEKGHNALKLWAFLRPPFRSILINEAGDLFSGPRLVALHARRRWNETLHNGSQATKDYASASFAWAIRRSGQHLAYLGALRKAGYWKCYHALEWSGSAIRAGYIPVKDEVRARFIYVFAFFAQLSTPLSRRVFKTFNGADRIFLKLVPLQDFSFEEIEIVGRRWNPEEISCVAEQSTASLLVFRQAGETGDVHAVLAPFEQPDIFAAAVQVQHADWRKKLLHKFPFRKLQPGEVTRTMAPYSSLIALRRDAVVQYGVPNVLSSGSAYMLLCWQAAASGLHSVTVGGDRSLVQEQDVPLEHAEFVKTLLDVKKLRRLSPGGGELSRGNICTSPTHHRKFSGRPRVLVISPYLPFPLAHGGAVRIFNMCRSLAMRVDFLLVCFREAVDTVHYDVLSEIFHEVHVVDNDEKNKDPKLPKQIPEYRNSAMRALVRELCATRDIDLVQIEYTQMAEYRDCAQGRPVLLVEHDVTFTLYRQLWEANKTAVAEDEYRRWLKFEAGALRDAECVWAMSNHDRELILEQGGRPSTTFAVPNGVDLHRFQPQSKSDSAPRILFIGSFRHLPNLLAFEALRDTIMPAVWKAVPNAELHVIAGPQHERCAKLAGKEGLLKNDARIRMDGFVEDVRPAYRESDVVVIPLPVSAGTNIKLMEAMACERAIVSTPVGCVGLDLKDGFDLAIRPIDAGFAEATIALLQDAHWRSRMGKQARQTAEQRFGWEAIGRDAAKTYDHLLQRANKVVSA